MTRPAQFGLAIDVGEDMRANHDAVMAPMRAILARHSAGFDEVGGSIAAGFAAR